MNRRQLLALSAGALTGPADLLGKLGAPEEDTGVTGLLDTRAQMRGLIPPTDSLALHPLWKVGKVDASKALSEGVVTIHFVPRVLTVDFAFETLIGDDV